VGEAANATLPGMKADKKEREARRLDAIKMYAQAEGITNEMASKRADAGLRYATTVLDTKEKSVGRLANLAIARSNDATQLEVADKNAASALAVAKENTTAAITSSEKLDNAAKINLQAQLAKVPQQATENVDSRLASDPVYQQLKGKDGAELQQKRIAYRAKLIAAEQSQLVAAINALIGPPAGTPPPATANTPKEGQKSVATDGRKIIYKNGRWEFIEKKS